MIHTLSICKTKGCSVLLERFTPAWVVVWRTKPSLVAAFLQTQHRGQVQLDSVTIDDEHQHLF